MKYLFLFILLLPASALAQGAGGSQPNTLANDYKANVRGATTANITIATALNAGDTLDGLTLAANDRILVKDQSTASQNGIYVVSASPARASDANAWAELPGSFVVVQAGTANKGKTYVCTAAETGTVGSTSITYAEKGATGAGTGDLLAANNLSDLASATTALNNLGIGSGDSVTFDGINLGTSIVISHDSDGAITILGNGNGFDEAITLNLDDTESSAVFSSSTGVSIFSFPGIQLHSGGAVLSDAMTFTGTTHPGLRLNNLTTTQRDAMTPLAGYTIYNTTNHQVEFYDGTDAAWEAVGGGGGGSVATDAIWDAAGDLAYGTGANTASRLAVGTANQLLQVNAGATAPEWTSSVTLSTVTATTGNIGSLVFEGATADAFETTFTVTDPTGDRVWNFGNVSANVTATDGATLTFQSTDTYVGRATTDTLTNKTLDASATGNTVKMFGYLVLTHPHVFGSGVTQQTTVTNNQYGQALFSNSVDKATNYVEYYCVIPPDVDTAVDLTATFKFQLSGADTNDHEYEITFDSVANSAAYAGTLGDAISLAYTADATGAANDVETAGETTLTGWRSAMTAGQLFVIRVARDGDHASDTSTVNSYSGPLVIKYGITQ